MTSTYLCTYTAHGIDYTFTQTNWNGGLTTNTANHTDNQTGWNQYSQKDANISFVNSGADMQLTNTTNTTHIDFNMESQYVQQDAANGTDFNGSQVNLHAFGIGGNDSNTKLLVHADGVNGSTAFVDSSSSPKTVTAISTQISTSQSKFGGASGYFNGSSSYLSVPDSDDWNFGSGDFTIDCWVKFNTFLSPGFNQWFLSQRGDYDSDSWALYVNSQLDGGHQIGLSKGSGVMNYPVYYTSYDWNINTWYHIAVSRSGNNWYLFRDGNLVSSRIGLNESMPNVSDVLNIGSYDGNTPTHNGYIDEIRVSKGVARWTSSFTPPTSAYGPISYPTTPSHITTNATSQKNTSTWGALTNITTTQTTPTNTNIKYLVSFDNRSTWKYWNGSSWQASTLTNIATNGMTKSTIEAITPSQWNTTNGFTPATFDIAASLSTTDASVTPSLDNIQITYTTPQTQTLTSNIYNTQDATTMLNHIEWTETLSTNTDVTFQLRTSPDGTNWTPWCGPDDSTQGSCNSSTYFTDPTGSETIDDIHTDKQGDQFIQYKAFLSTTNGLNSPTLNSVTLSYGTTQLPTLTTQNASDITPATATVHGTILTTGDENPTRAIEWGTTSGNYTQNCNANTGSAGPYTCQLTNLTPQTTYYFRAKATNAAGTSYGQEQSFTTLANTLAIPNPDTTKIENAVNDGYMTISNGTLTSAQQAHTVTQVTMTTQNVQATFPQNTQITGDGNFNFKQFTLTPTNVQDEQLTSRVALNIGIPNESLTFSQPITMQIYVGTVFNNLQMEVLYQNDNESDWHHHTYCTVANGYCTFTTDHATIYTVNGEHQTTGSLPMNLNVQVQETLSMDCFDPSDSNTTVSLGTAANPGLITAGTPAVGQSRCTVTTNADQGYYLTLTNSNPAHATLTHTDPHTATIYEIADTTPWNETTKATSNWTAPTTKGLGFSVITFPEVDTTHNEFNGVWNTTNQCPEGLTADTNEYAGIPATPQTISAVTSYQSAATTTNICYKVDVPASQPSGQYSGQVMFTATSDASGYYQ